MRGNGAAPLPRIFVLKVGHRGFYFQKKRKILLRTLLDGLEDGRDIFIQGVTVHESGDDIVLVDGQQRTTFFFLLLKFLGYDGYFAIRYDVRRQSDDFLRNLDPADCARDGSCRSTPARTMPGSTITADCSTKSPRGKTTCAGPRRCSRN